MTDTKYNGWTNYETWRVKLELFDDLDMKDEFDNNEPDFDVSMICPHTFADVLKDRAELYIENSSPEGLARDYALAFLQAVNWYEIATHLIKDYEEA